MLKTKGTVPIKSNIAIGRGKLSIIDESNGDIYVAVVHQDTSVEVIVLDHTGCLLETNTVNIKELIDIKVNQLQVAWCTDGDQRTLVISCTNQVALVKKDTSLGSWNAITNVTIQGLDENCLISTLVCNFNNIYIGGNKGLWEIGTDFKRQCLVLNKPVTVAKASEKWLAVGHEKGSIVLMQKVNEQWLDYSQLPNNPQSCCTDLHIETKSQVLVAAYSTGHIRLFSLETRSMLMEVAAHIRWINQLIQLEGGFLSISDDSFAHLWKFCHDGQSIDYVNSVQMKNCLLMNGAVLNSQNEAQPYHTFLLTVYDRPDMYILSI